MTATRAQLQAGLDGRTSATEYLSAHTDWSLTGLSEVFGGSYSRQLITWTAATSTPGSQPVTTVTNSNAVSLSIPASTTVRWLGRWTAETGGTFLGMVPNGSTKSKIGRMLGASSASHFRANGMVVSFNNYPQSTPAFWDGTEPFVTGDKVVFSLPHRPFADLTGHICPVMAAGIGGITCSGTEVTYDAAQEAATFTMIISNIVEADFTEAARLTVAIGEFKLTGLF